MPGLLFGRFIQSYLRFPACLFNSKLMKKAESVLPFAGIPEAVSPNADTVQDNDAKWFYGPKTDLIIGCGAWSAPLLLLTFYGTANFPQTIITIFYALALFFNYPHYMATIYRAFRTKEEFAKYKIFTVHITLLIALLVVLSHFSSSLLAFVFTLYLTWSPFHYTGQNFGIALMFARRNGVKTNLTTRRALYVSFLMPYLMFFFAFHSGTASDDYVLSLGIPPKIALFFWIIAAAAFLVSTVYSFRSFVKQTSFSAMTAPLVILSTQIVWFVIPTGLMFFTNIGTLQNPATIAVLAVMHSAQYLWITTYYARREKVNEQSKNNSPNHWRYSSYFSILVVGGIALFLPVPWLASRVLQLDFGTSFLIITALVNLHHFILDGAIWKLRDGRIAALLLNNKKATEGTDSQKDAAKWFPNSSFSLRFVKVAAVFGLLLLAGIDQVKFVYSAKGNDDANLRLASQMNPFDASLKLKLARSSEEKGNLYEAQSLLEEAVRINPSFRQAQDSLARLLIKSERYEEALNHYQKMFQHLKPDANSLVNYGVLAAQFNREDEALKSWQDALILDKNQPNAHFYAAELLSKRKNFDEAIKNYEKFLVLAADKENASGSAPYLVLQAAQSLSTAYRESGKSDKALTVLNNALRLSEIISDPEITAEVFIQRAETEAEQGKHVEVLSDFQRALTLTKTDASRGGNPEHWFKFGKFLSEIKADQRLSLACFIKAETLISDEQSSALAETIKAEINKIESNKTKENSFVRDKLSEVLQEALSLKIK